MAPQLAEHDPNPDVRSGKFGSRPTIGPKFGPSHLVGYGTQCHVERLVPQIAVKTFLFLFGHHRFWPPKTMKIFFSF